mmetsp:Transcript_18202/g.36877  ORF Transcript_18202/g.36877 Transcript_18202/m.36877 type:complete len:229 (+) Transcript_18202:413-1099(+)
MKSTNFRSSCSRSRSASTQRKLLSRISRRWSMTTRCRSPSPSLSTSASVVRWALKGPVDREDRQETRERRATLDPRGTLERGAHAGRRGLRVRRVRRVLLGRRAGRASRGGRARVARSALRGRRATTASVGPWATAVLRAQWGPTAPTEWRGRWARSEMRARGAKTFPSCASRWWTGCATRHRSRAATTGTPRGPARSGAATCSRTRQRTSGRWPRTSLWATPTGGSA